MIAIDKGRVIFHGNGAEIGAEATMLLILIYKENEDQFKEIIKLVTELIESGEVRNM